jgi:peroxiredoxin Q/BCP
MAQLRLDYDDFLKRNTDIVAIGPEDQASFDDFWHSHNMPFTGLADPEHKVENLYSQRIAFLTGRMPSIYIIDWNGKIRYIHHGESMSDISPNAEIFGLLDTINAEFSKDILKK